MNFFSFLAGIVLSVSLLASPASAASLGSVTTPGATTNGAFNILINAVGDLQKLKQQRTEKQIALTFEEQLTFPSLQSIEEIDMNLEAENILLNTLREEKKKFTPEEQLVIDEQLLEIQNLETEKKKYEETYSLRKERQQTNIAQFKSDLQELGEELEKQKQVIKAQLTQTFTWLFFILAVVVVLLILKFIATRLLIRFSQKMGIERKRVLLRVFRIAFNILIVMVLIGTISSQFMSVLPFIALLGTGVAFAIRDSLSSFMAWFIIGGDNGYKKGNVIQIGDAYGKVQEITPFLTLLKEVHGDHQTGKIITLPNKVIFEKPIHHFSKYNGFVYKEVSFLLGEDSDLEEAKSILLSIVQTVLAPEKKEKRRLFETLAKNFSIPLEQTEPVVWMENNSHGFDLRASFLTSLDNAGFVKNKIEEAFMKESQISTLVNFQFANPGRKQRMIEPAENRKE